MAEARHRESQGARQQDLLGGIGEVVVAAEHHVDARVGVVAHHRQVVGRAVVGAQDDQVVDVPVAEAHGAVDGVLPVGRALRDEEAHHVGLARLRPLFCLAGASASARRRAARVARPPGRRCWRGRGRVPRASRSPGTHARRPEACGRRRCVLPPGRSGRRVPRPSRCRATRAPRRIASVIASFERARSVSSMRSTKVPPLWRASSQLKSAVRAPPTCRNPVGDGAKRTRTGRSGRRRPLGHLPGSPAPALDEQIDGRGRGQHEDRGGQQPADQRVAERVPDGGVGGLGRRAPAAAVRAPSWPWSSGSAAPARGVPARMAACRSPPDSRRTRLMLSTSRIALLTTMPPIMMTPTYASRVNDAPV